MIEPNSLEELPLLKYHCTPGSVRRDDTDAYLDLGEYHEAGQELDGIGQEVVLDGE
jgi:hypothetical protein